MTKLQFIFLVKMNTDCLRIPSPCSSHTKVMGVELHCQDMHLQMLVLAAGNRQKSYNRKLLIQLPDFV